MGKLLGDLVGQPEDKFQICRDGACQTPRVQEIQEVHFEPSCKHVGSNFLELCSVEQRTRGGTELGFIPCVVRAETLAPASPLGLISCLRYAFRCISQWTGVNSPLLVAGLSCSILATPLDHRARPGADQVREMRH